MGSSPVLGQPRNKKDPWKRKPCGRRHSEYLRQGKQNVDRNEMKKGLLLNFSPSNQQLLGKYKKTLNLSPTPAETHINKLLVEIGEKFIFNKGFYTEKRFFIVDFYIPKRRKLCLEIDGGYHKDQVDYDMWRDRFLETKRGFRVKRLTNEDALRMNSRSLLGFISA